MLRILILQVDCDTLYDLDDDEIESVHEDGYQYRYIPRHQDRYMGLVKVAADKIFARLASTCLGLSVVVFRLEDRKFSTSVGFSRSERRDVGVTVKMDEIKYYVPRSDLLDDHRDGNPNLVVDDE
jgi:hypothetical protein